MGIALTSNLFRIFWKSRAIDNVGFFFFACRSRSTIIFKCLYFLIVEGDFLVQSIALLYKSTKYFWINVDQFPMNTKCLPPLKPPDREAYWQAIYDSSM